MNCRAAVAIALLFSTVARGDAAVPAARAEAAPRRVWHLERAIVGELLGLRLWSDDGRSIGPTLLPPERLLAPVAAGERVYWVWGGKRPGPPPTPELAAAVERAARARGIDLIRPGESRPSPSGRLISIDHDGAQIALTNPTRYRARVRVELVEGRGALVLPSPKPSFDLAPGETRPVWIGVGRDGSVVQLLDTRDQITLGVELH